MKFESEQILIDDVAYTVKVAKTADQRRFGLSERADVGADGMLFTYDYLVFRPFIMSRTVIPLVIAFFDDEMKFIGSRMMEPLSTIPVPPPGPFQYAVEFHREKVPALTVGESYLRRPLATK